MTNCCLQVDAHSFERMREGLVRKYANCNMAPEKHASYLRLRALKHLWHLDDTLCELKALTPADLQARFLDATVALLVAFIRDQ